MLQENQIYDLDMLKEESEKVTGVRIALTAGNVIEISKDIIDKKVAEANNIDAIYRTKIMFAMNNGKLAIHSKLVNNRTEYKNKRNVI